MELAAGPPIKPTILPPWDPHIGELVQNGWVAGRVLALDGEDVWVKLDRDGQRLTWRRQDVEPWRRGTPLRDRRGINSPGCE